jgi:branched-chain amino acid transport system substrate-binding protein
MKSSILRRSLPILLGATLVAGMSHISTAQTVKIGSLSAVTGPIANLAKPIIDAELLAIKQVNDAGGILGGRKLELVVGDTQCNAQASVDAASKLVNVEQVVAIVGALCSAATVGAASNVAVPAGVVMVSPASTSPAITGLEDKGLVFRTAPSDLYQGIVLASYVKSKGIDSVALTFVNNDYGVGLAESFRNAYLELGGKITGDQVHEDKKSSYRAELATLARGKPEALVVLAYAGTSGVTILRQSLENGFFKQFVGADGMRDDILIEQLGAAALKGNLFITQPTAPQSGSRNSFDSVVKASGADPSSPFVRQSYDATFLLALAIQKAGSTDRAAIKDALRFVAGPPGMKVGPGEWKKAIDALAAGRDIDYDGAAGPHDFDAAGDVPGVYGEYVVEGETFAEQRIIN